MSGTLCLLDVGALGRNYVKESKWIQVDAIDLNSQNPHIRQIDFFDFNPVIDYDIVALALVVNFVGDPRKRG